MMARLRDHLERSDASDVAEEYQRLVKCGVHVVGAGPALVNRGVGTDHMVVGKQVGVAEPLHSFRPAWSWTLAGVAASAEPASATRAIDTATMARSGRGIGSSW